MNRLILILGGSASGKSEYAEQYAVRLSGASRRCYYIATMEDTGEESLHRIRKHQERRRQMQFCTVECYRNIATLVQQNRIQENAVVLLECLTNLLANEMFHAPGNGSFTECLPDKLVLDIQKLCKIADVIVVSGDVSRDGCTYDASTMEYIRALSVINNRLAEIADETVEVVCGIPLTAERMSRG